MSEIRKLQQRVDDLTFKLADASAALRSENDAQLDGGDRRHRLTPKILLDAQDAMQRSERLMRSVFDSALDAMVLLDAERKLVDANVAAIELFARTREALNGVQLDALTVDATLDHAWALLFEHGHQQGSLEVLRPDGVRRRTEYSATSQVLPGIDAVILHDVTERRAAEESLTRINRLYAVLYKLNAAVLRTRDLEEIREQTCRILVDEGWLKLVWIGAATKEGRLHPVAWAGEGVEPLTQIDASAQLSALAEGPSAVALREGRADVCGDLNEPRMAPWRQATLLGGCHSAAAVPLPIRGPKEVLTLYAAQPNFFGDQELRLLERVAETLGIAYNLRDEEQRRLAVETRLKDSELRYRRIVETTAEGVLTIDASAHITFVNQHMADMLGYTRDEMVGTLVFEFFEGPGRARGMEMFERRREGVGDIYEQSYRHKDGREIWTLVSATPLINAEGVFEGAIGMVTDVTERRRERAEADALFALSPDIMCVAARDGRFVRLSPSFERILGYPVHEALSRSAFDFVHPDDLSKTTRAFEKVGRGEAVTGFESRYRSKAGGHHTLSWSAVAANEVIYAIARDVTDQHALEQQLRQAQKMEAVGNLAGGIAHDFNNVLSVMLAYTSMAVEDLPEGDRLRGDLEHVVAAALRASALTNQLLAFSRRQILEPQVMDLNACVRELGQMLARVLGEHIELSLSVHGSVGRVYADPSQIEQVIMNLVVNARDAMARGGKLSIAVADVEVAEGALPGLAPGHYVMLSVADTGTGIHAGTFDQIFEPFYTTKERGKGTGLGLSTVYGIVKQSGGHITVESELGRGATFRVYLPRSERPSLVSLAPRALAKNLRGTETILLAEDDPAVRQTMLTVLRRQGYEVLEAACGDDALTLSAHYTAPIHMLVTDVLMPRMNGRELAERLLLTRPHMRVLYVSGYTEDAIVHEGVLDAGIAYLRKPVTPDALARKMRELLDPPPDA